MTAPDTAPWLAYAPITVDVHIHSHTHLDATVHTAQDRVVLRVEGSNQSTVHLFVDRADLARLIDTASTALADLDTKNGAAPAA